jgi:4-amino-4-deoxy-L-arabinose transferase-like glycosyltransferase
MSTVVKPAGAASAWSGVEQQTIAVWGVVAFLTAVGAYLRLANLGELGFRWDEDLSSLAVKAILEKGIPELPSGMIYLRGGAFLYLCAASAQLLGFSELSLRLPAALFGIAQIPLAFVFARVLFNARVGLLAAGLIAISIWDVEFSRYARFYTPFAFFYVLTVLCIWRYRVQADSLGGGLLCMALAIVAITLHDLGYTLTIAFLAPLLFDVRGALRNPRRLLFPFGAAFAVGCFFLFWRWWSEYLRELPMAGATPSGGDVPQAAATAATLAGTVLERIPLVAALWERAPVAWIALACALLGAAAWFVARRRTGRTQRALVIAIAACCCLQLFNIALLGIAALAFLARDGVRGFAHGDVRFAAAISAVAFAVWLAVIVSLDLLGLGAQGLASSVKQSIRALLDYPHFFVFWGYPNEWPLVSLVAALGGMVAFDRAARPAPDRATVFLAFVLLSPLIVNGLFDTLYQLFRYNVPLNTFYFTFVALGIVHWRELVAAVRGPSVRSHGRLRPGAVAAGTGVLAALVLAYDVNPLRGLLAVQRDYREEGALYRLFAMQRYPDFESASGYVAAHAAPTDMILALDPREHFNYIGRLDYSVMSGAYDSSTFVDTGVRRDLYIATPLLTNLAALEEALGTPGKTKWLIADDAMLAESPSIDEPIREFVRDQSERVVYVARDRTHKVYRFD